MEILASCWRGGEVAVCLSLHTCACVLYLFEHTGGLQRGAWKLHSQQELPSILSHSCRLPGPQQAFNCIYTRVTKPPLWWPTCRPWEQKQGHACLGKWGGGYGEAEPWGPNGDYFNLVWCSQICFWGTGCRAEPCNKVGDLPNSGTDYVEIGFVF